jgi:hypothetical protein
MCRVSSAFALPTDARGICASERKEQLRHCSKKPECAGNSCKALVVHVVYCDCLALVGPSTCRRCPVGVSQMAHSLSSVSRTFLMLSFLQASGVDMVTEYAVRVRHRSASCVSWCLWRVPSVSDRQTRGISLDEIKDCPAFLRPLSASERADCRFIAR